MFLIAEPPPPTPQLYSVIVFILSLITFVSDLCHKSNDNLYGRKSFFKKGCSVFIVPFMFSFQFRTDSFKFCNSKENLRLSTQKKIPYVITFKLNHAFQVWIIISNTYKH